jgi:hypothetical protein
MGFKLEFGNDAHVYRVIALEFLPGMAYWIAICIYLATALSVLGEDVYLEWLGGDSLDGS